MDLRLAFLVLISSALHFSSANTLEEQCPCVKTELCPRLYGESLVDLLELGAIPACESPDQSRCCGASVQVAQGHDPIVMETVEDRQLKSQSDNSPFLSYLLHLQEKASLMFKRDVTEDSRNPKLLASTIATPSTVATMAPKVHRLPLFRLSTTIGTTTTTTSKPAALRRNSLFLNRRPVTTSTTTAIPTDATSATTTSSPPSTTSAVKSMKRRRPMSTTAAPESSSEASESIVNRFSSLRGRPHMRSFVNKAGQSESDKAVVTTTAGTTTSTTTAPDVTTRLNLRGRARIRITNKLTDPTQSHTESTLPAEQLANVSEEPSTNDNQLPGRFSNRHKKEPVVEKSTVSSGDKSHEASVAPPRRFKPRRQKLTTTTPKSTSRSPDAPTVSTLSLASISIDDINSTSDDAERESREVAHLNLPQVLSRGRVLHVNKVKVEEVGGSDHHVISNRQAGVESDLRDQLNFESLRVDSQKSISVITATTPLNIVTTVKSQQVSSPPKRKLRLRQHHRNPLPELTTEHVVATTPVKPSDSTTATSRIAPPVTNSPLTARQRLEQKELQQIISMTRLSTNHLTHARRLTIRNHVTTEMTQVTEPTATNSVNPANVSASVRVAPTTAPPIPQSPEDTLSLPDDFLRTDVNSHEIRDQRAIGLTSKNQFKQPDIEVGGFMPILPYSVPHPGVIRLVRVPQKKVEAIRKPKAIVVETSGWKPSVWTV